MSNKPTHFRKATDTGMTDVSYHDKNGESNVIELASARAVQNERNHKITLYMIDGYESVGRFFAVIEKMHDWHGPGGETVQDADFRKFLTLEDMLRFCVHEFGVGVGLQLRYSMSEAREKYCRKRKCDIENTPF